MKMIRAFLAALVVSAAVAACGASTITAPDVPPSQENVMGSDS